MTTLNPNRGRKSKATGEPVTPGTALTAVSPQVPAPTHAPHPANPVTKQAQLIELLLRDDGATIGQMIATTGWLPHTTRAALTGLKKKGFAISSDKLDGLRTYRGIAPEVA